MRHSRAQHSACLTAALLAAAGAAHAQQESAGIDTAPSAFELGLTAGSTWTDNVALQPAGEETGAIGQVGLGLLYREERRRLRADVEVNAAYQHYWDDQFEDDIVGGLDGTLIFGIVPERFEWFVQENFGQSRLDPLEAATPANREDVSYFTTGPDLMLRLGSATTLRVSGRYSGSDYEETDLDGSTYSGRASLIRHLSTASALSLNASSERLEYENSAAHAEYDRHEAYLRYEAAGRRTELALDVGWSMLDESGETTDGELLRLTLRRQSGRSSAFDLNLGIEYSDASSMFRSMQDLGGVSIDPEYIVATAEPFRRQYAGLGWSFTRLRTFFGVNGDFSDEEYERTPGLDRTLARYGAYIGRQLTRNVRVRLDGRYIEEDFESQDIRTEELQAALAVDWAIGRTLSWRLQYDYRDRTGSGPNVAEYRENRVSMFVTWSPFSPSR